MPIRTSKLILAAPLLLVLGGCMTAVAGASSPLSGGPADSTGGAAACGAAIANFEAVVNKDAETGNLNRSVHARIVRELGPIKAACAAGRDAEARAKLAALRSRTGYP